MSTRREGQVAPRRRLPPEERREEILAAAREVFRETGLHGATMANVADRAGITKPHLYRHFNKQDLYRHAVLDPLEELSDRVVRDTRELAEQPGSTRAELLKQFHKLCLDHSVEVIPLLRAQGPSWDSSGGWLDQGFLVPRWRELLFAVIADVTGWEPESLNVELLARAFMGLYASIALVGELSGSGVDTERTAAGLTTMFAPSHLDRAGRAALKRALRDGRADGNGAADIVGAPAPEALADSDDETQGNGGTRRRLKKADRQASILKATRPLFCDVGLDGARTQELAESAGITEAFLFEQFPSKEQLYEEAIEAPVEAALAALASDIRELAGRESGVAFMIGFNVLAVRWSVEYGRLIATAFGAELERSRRFFNDRALPHFDGIGDVLVEQMGYGPEIDSRLAWSALLGSAWGISHGAATTESGLDVYELAVHLTRMETLGAVATRQRRTAAS